MRAPPSRRAHQIKLVHFRNDDRRQDVMRPYLERQAATGLSGVAVGVAQEYQNVFATSERDQHGSAVVFTFRKADRRVTCFYFYLWDLMPQTTR
jgi:hypothetical protein